MENLAYRRVYISSQPFVGLGNNTFDLIEEFKYTELLDDLNQLIQ